MRGEIKKADGTVLDTEGLSIMIKVDGEEKAVSIQDALTMAEKASGADARFREASILRAQANKGLRIAELSANKEQLDEKEFVELFGLLGGEKEEAVDQFELYNKLKSGEDFEVQESPQGGEETYMEDFNAEVETPTSQEASKEVTALKQELANMKQQLGLVGDFTRTQALAQVKKKIQTALDSHDKMGKLTDKQKAILHENMMQTASEYINETGKEFDDSVVRHSVKRAEIMADSLGILPEGLEEKAKHKLTELHKVGAALSSNPSEITESIITGKAPTRIPSTDPDYEDNFATRMMLKHGDKEIVASDSPKVTNE